MAKTLKLKKPEVSTQQSGPVLKKSEDSAPAPAQAAAAPENGGGIYVSKRHQLQGADSGKSSGGSGGSFTWAAVLAIIALLLWLAILFIEYMDWTQLSIA